MTVKMIFSHKENVLLYNNLGIQATCDVRSLKNGRRKKNEVVYSIPSNKPYDPMIFPIGIWEVGKPLPKTEPYKAPFFIPTNAWRQVTVWHVDDFGNYDSQTSATVKDEAYGLHFSTSKTTIGCIRIGTETDLRDLVTWIERHLKLGDKILLEVTE